MRAPRIQLVSSSQIPRKVIDNLSHQARPIDRVHCANFVLALELQIIRHRLNDVLAIVKHAFNGDVVNVLILQAKHLRLLKRAHAAVWRRHKHPHPALAAHRVFSCAAGVAAGRAKNIELLPAPRQFVFKQIAKQLHRHVFES